ncbi:MAG TPA: alpha/beta hydrolase [Actinophytocola sp.]|uniref:alpha/beta hydrolase n=1 Tax=Actinophytocola sp. TaxID=1872138 RepID=UPI002DBD86E0|nr:alpha/beta hydrolase [Actinophytocola sp.]HEU5473433.1 alpha/beta hydrolase [Actinophytocola sp.]
MRILMCMVIVAGLILGSPAAQATPDVTVLKDVAYAPAQPAGSQGHLLDLYLPRTRGPVPLVIFSHGSGWLAENGRQDADIVAARLNPRGYAVAGVAIRSSRNAIFPAQLHDIKAAIRFLRANAARYHLDPHRFGIMGESSGGWTAAMAAVTGDRPGLEGDVGVRGPSSRVQAAVPIYPPTDFLQMDRHMLQDCVPFNETFGLTDCHADPASPESRLLGCAIGTCPDRVAAANPVTWVSRRDPPMLIMHGQQDLLVPWQQSPLLFNAVRRACGTATLVLLPRGEHGQWNEYLTDPAVNAGAVARHTGRCGSNRAEPVRLSWGYLADFFDRAMFR